jgi:hypothetical protein
MLVQGLPFAAFNAVQMAQSQGSVVLDLSKLSRWGLLVKWTDGTPTAKTFTADAATDILTANGHGLVNQQVVRVSTTGGLPAPLAAVTDYYVIVIDANTFYLATSRANAIAGVHIDITSAGTGVQTETPSTLACTVKMQYAAGAIGSVVDADFFDMGSGSVAIPGAGSPLQLTDKDVPWNVGRLVFTPTAGSGLLTCTLYGKA